MPNPIVHEPLREKIFENLMVAILEGKLVPGERLNLEMLADHMNVSRTPLQEALVRLEKEGFVQSIPRRGTFVKKISSEEMVEIYELREVLEVYAAKSATSSITDGILDSLNESCARYEQAMGSSNIFKCLEEDIRFHHFIVEASRNQKLAQIMHTFYLQIHSIHLRGPNYMKFAPEYLKDHRDILSALSMRDPLRASELIGLHIRKGKDLLSQVMIQDESTGGSASSAP